MSMNAPTTLAGASASPMPVRPASSVRRTTTVSAAPSQSSGLAADSIGMTSTSAIGETLTAATREPLGVSYRRRDVEVARGASFGWYLGVGQIDVDSLRAADELRGEVEDHGCRGGHDREEQELPVV